MRYVRTAARASAAAAALALPAMASDPARPGFQPLRFNEDWSVFADRTGEQRTDPFDAVKYIRLTDDGAAYVSFGGSARTRLETWNGFNFGAPPSARHNDTFVLGRILLHADLHLGENVRIFAEGISAMSGDRRLPGGRRVLDVNTLDAQNAFLDLRLPFADDASVTLRAGRQELLFGRQRLVSPLDWANTKRTFDGVCGIVSYAGWTFHGFWTQPVPVRKYELSRGDSNSDFYGLHATGALDLIDASLELYWYGLHRDDPVAYNETSGRERRHTLGSRLFGVIGESPFDYDVEGAYQFGEVGPGDVSAFMVAAQVGYRFGDAWSRPRIFAGFDYASGDRSTGGDVQTFNQLFPLGHAFLGWLDAIGRQNIMAFSTGVTFTPIQRLTVNLHGHYFLRARRDDALYNVGGGVSRPGSAGDSREVGSEIDLLLQYQLNRQTSFLLGYSYFIPGDFIKESGPSRSTGFFYAGAEFRF